MLRTPKRAAEIIVHNNHWIEWNRQQIAKGRNQKKHNKRIQELQDHIKQIRFEAILTDTEIPE